MKSRAILTVVILATAVPALGDADVAVRLGPAQQSVRAGQTPQFSVTVRALSSTVRVLKFSERGDLRDNYARLVVTKSGSRVELVPFISDPGPTSDGDYIDLSPGRSMTFTHNGSPFPLRELKAGTYSAHLLLQRDWSLSPVQSNTVSFQVTGS